MKHSKNILSFSVLTSNVRQGERNDRYLAAFNYIVLAGNRICGLCKIWSFDFDFYIVHWWFNSETLCKKISKIYLDANTIFQNFKLKINI